MTLVFARTDEMGCTCLEVERVSSIAEAAQVLLQRGVHPYDARLFRGSPVSPPDAEENPLQSHFDALSERERERSDREQYERLKARFEPEIANA